APQNVFDAQFKSTLQDTEGFLFVGWCSPIAGSCRVNCTKAKPIVVEVTTKRENSTASCWLRGGWFHGGFSLVCREVVFWNSSGLAVAEPAVACRNKVQFAVPALPQQETAVPLPHS